MNHAQLSPLSPETLGRLAEILNALGVVGNEGDWRFDAQDLPESQDELHALLKKAGYRGGGPKTEPLTPPHDGVDVLIYDPTRYVNAGEAEEARERDYRNRWHDQIERRADDWLNRLSQLRSQISAWLMETPDLKTLTIVDRPAATMSEELMMRFGVPPKQMPVFEIRNDGQRLVRFQPKGLWIIGANGRVDIVSKNAAPILVDHSEPLARPSDWRIYDSRDRARSVPFTRKAFVELVRAALQ
jgi:hypothetical protein